MAEISALPLIELIGPSPRTLLHRRLWGHKGLVISVALLTLIGLVALLAPVLAPYDPYAQDLGRRLIPPVWYQKGTWVHWLGTDNLGRDYLSRVLYGARISLLIGASVMAISGLIGTTLGLAAGYFGGRVDALVMFTTTVRLAMPLILVALAVVATIEAASAILLEAALSFLGLGVQPPLPSWGLMIAEGKVYMFFSFWLIAIPGTALAILVLAINMLGDGIRDVTAPGGRA